MDCPPTSQAVVVPSPGVRQKSFVLHEAGPAQLLVPLLHFPVLAIRKTSERIICSEPYAFSRFWQFGKHPRGLSVRNPMRFPGSGNSENIRENYLFGTLRVFPRSALFGAYSIDRTAEFAMQPEKKKREKSGTLFSYCPKEKCGRDLIGRNALSRHP